MKLRRKPASFPSFSKLDIKHKRQITKFTGRFEPYSDFNFTSLFSWNVDNSAELSLLNDNLVIRLPDYLDGTPVYSLLGTTMIDESINQLLSHTHKLKLVPEIVVENIRNQSQYTIEEDRDNFDYIYDLEELSHMANGKYKKVRYKANGFHEDHDGQSLDVKLTRSISPGTSERLKNLVSQWSVETNRDKGDTKAEREAINNLLDNFDEFDLMLTELLVDGDLKAFSINEVIAQGYSICHFEKALLSYHPHTYTYMVRSVARNLLESGCRYVNWEQDLGLEGIRRSKLSYHPYKMLKKYTVSLAGAGKS